MPFPSVRGARTSPPHVVSDGTPVFSGETAWVAVESLSSGPKHWRARARHAAGWSSEWMSFGSNSEGEPDAPPEAALTQDLGWEDLCAPGGGDGALFWVLILSAAGASLLLRRSWR